MGYDTKNSEGERLLPQKQDHLTPRRTLNPDTSNMTTGHLLKADVLPHFFIEAFRKAG
jgi:hypothetical protein